MYLEMPTDEQLAAKRVPLTTSDDDSIWYQMVPAYPQVSQLVGFMEASGIPMDAPDPVRRVRVPRVGPGVGLGA